MVLVGIFRSELQYQPGSIVAVPAAVFSACVLGLAAQAKPIS